MSSDSKKTASRAGKDSAGANLREEVEQHGTRLAECLGAMLGTLPSRPSGPQALSDLLGITVVTASRLLRAIDHPDPVAVIQQLPGTNPLTQTLDAAATKGASKKLVKEARTVVESFDEFVRKTAGNRSSLDAMLTDWLPQGRREFEVRRRQAAFKAISELKGVSCNLDLATLVVHPSETEGHLDLLSIQGTFGVDRIRPDAVVRFGSRRLPPEGVEKNLAPVDKKGRMTTRHPLNLDGQPASDGLHTVRLDQFCSTTPAPLEAKRFGDDVQYTLGQTGFGPNSSVDFVIAEVNRAEIRAIALDDARTQPYFFQMPAAPARAMLFDLLIHRDVWPDGTPELMVYDTSIRGPAHAGLPVHDVDILRTTEDLETLGMQPSRRRFTGFPRYMELLDYSFEKLGWASNEFRAFRLHMIYPLHGTQACMVIKKTGETSQD